MSLCYLLLRLTKIPVGGGIICLYYTSQSCKISFHKFLVRLKERLNTQNTENLNV